MSITTRDQLLTLALYTARVLPAGQTPRQEDIALSADYFNLELLALQARSDILQTIPRKSLTLVAGTATYTLPSDTIDVKLGTNDEVGTIVPTTGAESQVFAISRAEYLSLAKKDSSGRPTRAYIEKTDVVKMVLWPVPDAYSVSLSYAQVRIATESANGAASIDLQRKWFKAIMLATAAEVARSKSMGVELYGSLRKEANDLFEWLRTSDVQHGSIRTVMSHRVNRWS